MNYKLEKPVIYDTIGNYTCNEDSGDKYSPLMCLFSGFPCTIKPEYLSNKSKYESIFWHFQTREKKTSDSKSSESNLHEYIEHSICWLFQI